MIQRPTLAERSGRALVPLAVFAAWVLTLMRVAYLLAPAVAVRGLAVLALTLSAALGGFSSLTPQMRNAPASVEVAGTAGHGSQRTAVCGPAHAATCNSIKRPISEPLLRTAPIAVSRPRYRQPPAQAPPVFA